MTGFPPPPLHGFHGRARELLDLERAFAARGILVLHGFGGQGKTSLAAQAAKWFSRTRLFERAVFLSFEHGLSFETVLHQIGNALVGENFQIYEGDKVQAIADALHAQPALLVFDNFESALPGGNAPMPELQDLLNAAAKWFQLTPDTRHPALLITTRNPNIPHPAFSPGKNCLHKELTGLAPADALELAASILEAHSLPRPPRAALESLLDFLKGHPLSLQLALPHLRAHTAEQLVAQYQAILPQIKTGDANERNDSLEVSLRFSLDRLGAEVQNLLTRLAVFEGGAWEPVLLKVTEIAESDWNALKPQLTATALIRLEEIPGVSVPYVHFHPTLAPFLRALSEIQNYQLPITRYWQVYYALANQLYEDDTQHPIQARALAARELPNLKRALRLGLAAGALGEAVDFAKAINWFLDYFGRWRERDEIAELVQRAFDIRKSNDDIRESNSDSRISKSEYMLESGRGERLLQQGRAGQAEQVFRALLAHLEGDPAHWGYQITVTLQSLGHCLSAQGRPSQAAALYRRGLSLAEGLQQTENVKRQVAAYHVDLADVLVDSGQYNEARQEYEIGLKVMREIDDDRSEGAILGQLGTLALRQGELQEARQRYQEALALFQRMGENQTQAAIWHQLGMVAEEALDWDEAERCYKQSVNIEEQLGNLPGVAQTCNQLAIVAEKAERLQEAERWYVRAIELKEKHSTPKALASSLNNLAGLYLTQDRLDEAEGLARRALAIKETLDLSAQPWTTYGILAQIAEKRGRLDKSRDWRRKEQESFAAFAGSDHEIRQFEPLIATIVNAAQGDEKAKAFLEGEYLKMQSGGDVWQKVSKPLQSIVNGERNVDLLTEGLPRTQSLIIRRVLQALEGEEPSPPAPLPQGEGGGCREAGGGQGGAAQGEQGITLPQLLDLVERAAEGDHELGGKLFPMLQELSRADDKETSALGNVLLRVLVGERNPDLSALPDELASAIRGLLGRLKH